MESFGILRSVRLHQAGLEVLSSDGSHAASTAAQSPDVLYRSLGFGYPKFFKMDLLSKCAWLAAEILLSGGADKPLYTGLDKRKISVVLATGAGCLDVDKRYSATMNELPSPALFVYTLPNIMLGEICIRHGLTGEQLCLIQDTPDWDELQFCAQDFLQRGAVACLCGWVDATADGYDVRMAWLVPSGENDDPHLLQHHFSR